ncbi:hypothetical protein CBR_g48463 [Chara braunii]|uniref:Uncharacterized protein n=1 Tax=Chara braunii TaxID=69332 RepID=A0A388M2S7_CHABU|nr:hypothetical protein CBR_g48463 [Chara braunii]|eukprot:GBG88851.1 hypothetical protein CBR_g48463 [Chara braunii]
MQGAGHYANQCPNRERPSTSFDVRRGRSTSPRKTMDEVKPIVVQETVALKKQIEELNRSLASVSEFVNSERLKKEEEERKQKEEEEEARPMEEAEEAKERKNKKRAAKLQREAERIAEMDKRLKMKLALRTGDFFEKIEANLGPVIELARHVKGKNKGISQPASASGSGSDGDDSATEDIRRQTRNLTIGDKRKRGPEPVF